MSSDSDQPRQSLGSVVARALDNPWVVIGLLFFVFAILGIPLIWISKAFPTWGKVALTIIVTLYTVLLLWGFSLIMLWSYNRIIDAL